MAEAADPFTFLFDTLWTYLEANSDFTDLVKERNRIKVGSGFKPFKEAIVESSVPEVCLLPAGKRFFEKNPCNGASIVQIINITIASGVRNTGDIFPVQYQIAKVIHAALNTDVAASRILNETWNSEKIIISINLLPMEEGLQYDDLNRKLLGWAAILPMEVELFLPNDLLGITE